MISEAVEVIIALLILMLINLILFFGIIIILWIEKKNREAAHKQLNKNVMDTNFLFKKIVEELQKK